MRNAHFRRRFFTENYENRYKHFAYTCFLFQTNAKTNEPS